MSTWDRQTGDPLAGQPSGEQMLIHVAAAIVVLLASAPLAPQFRPAISVEEWREVLSGVRTEDDDSLLKVSSRYSEQSTAMIKSGNRQEATHKSLISLVLTKQIHFRMQQKGLLVERQHIDAANQLQTALEATGFSQSALTQSAINLGMVLNERPATMVIQVRQNPRPATAAERAAMIVAIKEDLIDPTAPLFGRADVVGYQACLTVNSKNRYGGYTGNQEATLYFNPKTKVWTGGGITNIPHGVCLDLLD